MLKESFEIWYFLKPTILFFYSTPWVRHNTLYMIKHVEVVTYCKGLVRLVTAKKYVAGWQTC